MYPELLSQIKRADVQREVAELHRAAAAQRAQSEERGPVAAARPRAVPSVTLRLLRALRLAS